MITVQPGREQRPASRLEALQLAAQKWPGLKMKLVQTPEIKIRTASGTRTEHMQEFLAKQGDELLSYRAIHVTNGNEQEVWVLDHAQWDR